jgi:hypothetical protein
VTYLMAFSCIFFMTVFMLFFGIFSLVSWVHGVFVDSTSYSGRDGDEGVDFPPFVLYSVD